MARYIDADKVMEEIEQIGGHNLCEWQTIGVKALIDRQPTVDVEPKSEFERLTVELEAMRTAANSYKMHYENLAREIFEELEKYFYNNEHKTGVLLYCNFFNLKKNYIEDTEETKVAAKKFFSPEDVCMMSLKEVKENYRDIQRSMEQWK
jgi:hypothetical protein